MLDEARILAFTEFAERGLLQNVAPVEIDSVRSSIRLRLILMEPERFARRADAFPNHMIWVWSFGPLKLSGKSIRVLFETTENVITVHAVSATRTVRSR